MKKVLIIEDNVAIRENTAELLELNNFKVFIAETAQEGYELAKKHVPDIIIYNTMEPETNVESFLKRLKNEIAIKNIPLIYFSDDLLSREFREHAVTGTYLQKPFTEEKLILAITNALQNIRA